MSESKDRMESEGKSERTKALFTLGKLPFC